MSWEQGLSEYFGKGDSDFDRLFELASEWQVKAISFARLQDRSSAQNALRLCSRSLLVAAQQVNASPPKEIDFEKFWEEFSSPNYPGPNADPNEPSRVPKRPGPSQRGDGVALPLPQIEDC